MQMFYYCILSHDKENSNHIITKILFYFIIQVFNKTKKARTEQVRDKKYVI